MRTLQVSSGCFLGVFIDLIYILSIENNDKLEMRKQNTVKQHWRSPRRLRLGSRGARVWHNLRSQSAAESECNAIGRAVMHSSRSTLIFLESKPKAEEINISFIVWNANLWNSGIVGRFQNVGYGDSLKVSNRFRFQSNAKRRGEKPLGAINSKGFLN